MGPCRYFSTLFGICCRFSKYRDIDSVFSVFYFASKRHAPILKFCFRVSAQILTEDPSPRSRRWQKLYSYLLSAQAPTYRWQRVGVNLAHWMRRTQKN